MAAVTVEPQPDGNRRGRRNAPRGQGIIYNWDSCVEIFYDFEKLTI